MNISYLKTGPNICPVCKKRCKNYANPLSEEEVIHVHSGKYVDKGIFEASKRCISKVQIVKDNEKS